MSTLNRLFIAILTINHISGSQNLLSPSPKTLSTDQGDSRLAIFNNDDEITIADTTRTLLVKMNKQCPYALEDSQFNSSGITLVFNFGSFVQPNNYPENCQNLANDTCNYIISDGTHCTTGYFSSIPKVSVESSTGSKSIFLALNSQPSSIYQLYLTNAEMSSGGKNNINLTKSSDAVGDNIYSFYLALGADKSGGIDWITLEQESLLQRIVKIAVLLLIFLITSYFFVLFSYEYQGKTLYYFQFGIWYNLLSQGMLGAVDLMFLESNIYLQTATVVAPLLFCYIFARWQMAWITFVWVTYSVADYILIALLMISKYTLPMALMVLLIFIIFSVIISCLLKGFKKYEVYLSFVVSLSLVSQFNNYYSSTTTVTRVLFLWEGTQLYEADPSTFYAIFGSIAVVLGIIRTLSTRFFEWNQKFVTTRDQEILEAYNQFHSTESTNIDTLYAEEDSIYSNSNWNERRGTDENLADKSMDSILGQL